MTARAVTIRILSGSQEAQYLAAYCPLTLPAFIIINNGQLVLDIRAGEKRDDFKAAILNTLSSTSSQPQRTTSSQTSDFDTSVTQGTSNHTVPQASTFNTRLSSAHSSLDQQEASSFVSQHGSAASSLRSSQSATLNSDLTALPLTDRNAVSHANIPSSNSQSEDPIAAIPSHIVQSMPVTSSSPPRPQASQTVQDLLADRRRRLESEKKERDATEKAERKAKIEGRKHMMLHAPNSDKANQAAHAAQQKKRQEAAKLDRERILRQIEHDKVDRREKEERRKANTMAEAERVDGTGRVSDQQLASEMNFSDATKSKECAVQVRLFDGSTIRSRFSPDQTLRLHVRPWVEQKKSDDIPYTFKQVLTPMPNRTLSIVEEEETLQSLGLSPSATLVIVPIKDFATVYSDRQSILSKGASAGYNVVCTGAGMVTGALGAFLGLGRVTTPGEVPDAYNTTAQWNPEAGTIETGSSINIRTLRDQRDDREDHQLYNGNQVLSIRPISRFFKLILNLFFE